MKQFVYIVVICLAFMSPSYANLLLETTDQGDTLYVLDDQILANVHEYEPLLMALRTAKKGDQIYIKINFNRGGRVSTMNTLGRAMLNSKAIVKVLVQGSSGSAAAQLMFYGDYLILPHGASIMYHTGYYCPRMKNTKEGPVCSGEWIRVTKGSNYFQWAVSYGGYYNVFALDTLSPEQLVAFSNGDDVYITGQQICQGKFKHPFVIKNKQGYCVLKGAKQTGFKR